jgi:cell division septation protein DedD
MNDHSVEPPQGKNQTGKRRIPQRLWYYVGSVVAGVICGFLLGNSWSRQPVAPTYDGATLAASESPPSPAPPTFNTSDTSSVAEVTPDEKEDVSSAAAATAPGREEGVARATSLVQEPPASQVLPAGMHPPAVQVPAAMPPPAGGKGPVAVAPPAVVQKSVAAHEPPAQPFYLVQVGAFRNGDNAVRAVSQLKSKGFEADLVKPGQHDPHGLYRVYIARFHDESRAKAAAVAFQAEENRKAYVVRYQPPPPSVSAGQR